MFPLKVLLFYFLHNLFVGNVEVHNICRKEKNMYASSFSQITQVQIATDVIYIVSNSVLLNIIKQITIY